MMVPTCNTCQTDRFLKYLDYTPGYSFEVGSGRVTRTQHRTPEVTFFCQKCGAFNGLSVPDDWEVPGDPDISELVAEGRFWSSHYEIHELQPDGKSWRITARAGG